MGNRNPWTDRYKIFHAGAVQDVITPANFCEDRLRGFGVARGRILAFSIDLLRRLDQKRPTVVTVYGKRFVRDLYARGLPHSLAVAFWQLYSALQIHFRSALRLGLRWGISLRRSSIPSSRLAIDRILVSTHPLSLKRAESNHVETRI